MKNQTLLGLDISGKCAYYKRIIFRRKDFMRITANIPDQVAKNIRTFAENEKKSISAVISEAVQYFFYEKKRLETGNKVLDLIGRVTMSKDIDHELEKMRQEADL
jgi:metal-responsive CopG/Arc/MetJ family transcriptional regulator